MNIRKENSLNVKIIIIGFPFKCIDLGSNIKQSNRSIDILFIKQ